MSPSFFFLNEDARILDQMRKGDEEALVTLYKTNERQVTAFVLRNNGTRDDAEDMLQEALVTLWERVKTGHYEHSAKLSTFVFAMVRNMWLRKLARARHEVVSGRDDETASSDDKSALDTLIENEQKNTIATALEKLGDPCRTILLLYYWEELPMDQIARQMGFANSDTVKSKKYQCKKSLEKLLTGLD